MKGKTFTWITSLGVIATLGLASCGSSYHAGSGTSDDVYYTPRAGGDEPSGNGSTAPSSSSGKDDYYDPNYSSRESDPNSNGSTYNSDDNYDYTYSSRIKRFYTPVSGYGYYDPYYTNSYYYDYNPVNWGASIYLGYPFWGFGLSYGYPGWGLSFNFGWGYPSYGYPYYGYGYPYYGYGYPYYPYYGYNCFYPGYYNSCYGYGYGYGYSCYNPCYYNSYDGGGVYYGPRTTTSSDIGRSASSRTAGSVGSVGSAYESEVASGRIAAANPALAGRLNSEKAPAYRSDPVTPTRSQSISEKNSRGRTSTTPRTGSVSEGATRPSTPVEGSESPRGGRTQNHSVSPNGSSDRPGQESTAPRSSSPRNNEMRTPANENRMQERSPSRESAPSIERQERPRMPESRMESIDRGEDLKRALGRGEARTSERPQPSERSQPNVQRGGDRPSYSAPSQPRSRGSVGPSGGGGRSSGGSFGGSRGGGGSSGGRSSGGRR